MPKQPTPPKAATRALVDKKLKAPDGTELHILLDADFKKNAERYQNALMVSRNIPFDRSTLTIMDWVAIVYSKQLEIQIPDDKARAQRAIQMAAATYDRWEEKAKQEAWTLAMLTKNKFSTPPEPYEDESDDDLPGLMPELNPQRDLGNPIEYRLKQILDYINQDVMFQLDVQAEINGAVAEAIRLVETDIAGFRPDAAN